MISCYDPGIMKTTLIQWALGVMKTLQPVEVTPWADSYESSAATIVKVAEEDPLYGGPNGVKKTVALYLSIGWYEGRFNQKAKGDCKVQDEKGRCIAQPRSFCMFQVGNTNFKALGVTADEMLNDFETCVVAAKKMIRTSFRVCRGREDNELLGHYASGGNTCGGLRESRHRIATADRIVTKFLYREETDDGT